MPAAVRDIVIEQGATFRLLLTRWIDDGFSRRVRDAAMTAGSATLSSATAAFTAADVGRAVQVWRAGTNGGKLITTIAAYVSATEVTLAAAAIRTVADGCLWVYTPVDLTGHTGRMQIRETPGSSVIGEFTSANGKLVITGNVGTTAVRIEATETDDYDPITAVYDLEDVSGLDVERVVEGKAYIHAEVTRP